MALRLSPTPDPVVCLKKRARRSEIRARIDEAFALRHEAKLLLRDPIDILGDPAGTQEAEPPDTIAAD